MATINLLPSQLVLKGKDKILIEGIKKFVFVGFILLIIGSLIVVGYLIFISLRIRSSISNEEFLKSEIDNLQETEQGLFLIKDRISKIKSIYAKQSADAQIALLTDFLLSNQGDYRIIEIQIISERVDLGVSFPSSSSFGLFYKALISSEIYSQVVLKSFSFNPTLGYIATFELTQK